MRAALQKIPLANLYAKLGFKFTGDDAPEREIALEHEHLNHRVLFTDQSFRIEFYCLGSYEWKPLKTKTKGTSGAIDFMMSLPQAVGRDGRRVDSLTLTQACDKLFVHHSKERTGSLGSLCMTCAEPPFWSSKCGGSALFSFQVNECGYAGRRVRCDG